MNELTLGKIQEANVMGEWADKLEAVHTLGQWISRETGKRKYDKEELRELSKALMLLKETFENEAKKGLNCKDIDIIMDKYRGTQEQSK